LSAKVQSLVRQGPGPRDPDRLALAIAISARDAAAKKVAEARASIGRAHRYVDQCSERLELATAAGVEARDNLARRVTASAVDGTSFVPDGAMRAARLDEQDAEDCLAAAKAALAAVSATVEDPESHYRASETRVTEAARVVLAKSADEALQAALSLRAQLTTALGAIWAIHREAFPWPPTPESERVRMAFTYLPQPNLSLDNPGAAAWSAYWSELLKNADAAPPSI
jgi:hypothetical protein